MFDARAFLAEQLGCAASELAFRDRRVGLGDGSAAQAYERAGALAGRIVVTRARRNLAGQNQRLVIATLGGRPTAYVQIAPDVEIVW